MARLIDADRALEVVRSQGIAHPNAYQLTRYATLILREAPTVDAVPVVRCKDCEYRDRTTGICNQISERISISRNKGARMKPYDFCSYGERKDGDDE